MTSLVFLTLTVIVSFWPARSFNASSGIVIWALKPLSGKGPGVLEATGALPWVGADGFVAFLHPAAPTAVAQAMASRPILNFVIDCSSLFSIDPVGGSWCFHSSYTVCSCGFVNHPDSPEIGLRNYAKDTAATLVHPKSQRQISRGRKMCGTPH